MKVRVRIQQGAVVFTSDMAKRVFFDHNEGKDAYLEIDDSPSDNLRRYFEGAVVPAVYYQHPHSGWGDFKDVREALKLEFLPSYTVDIHGERSKYARSTTELSKERFAGFVELVTQWLESNGMEVPDPEAYKNWRDSAPPAGEVYPQLARMKVAYDAAKATAPAPTYSEGNVPIWRRPRPKVEKKAKK